jgi:hypothetical protein
MRTDKTYRQHGPTKHRYECTYISTPKPARTNSSDTQDTCTRSKQWLFRVGCRFKRPWLSMIRGTSGPHARLRRIWRERGVTQAERLTTLLCMAPFSRKASSQHAAATATARAQSPSRCPRRISRSINRLDIVTSRTSGSWPPVLTTMLVPDPRSSSECCTPRGPSRGEGARHVALTTSGPAGSYFPSM